MILIGIKTNTMELSNTLTVNKKMKNKLMNDHFLKTAFIKKQLSFIILFSLGFALNVHAQEEHAKMKIIKMSLDLILDILT